MIKNKQIAALVSCSLMAITLTSCGAEKADTTAMTSALPGETKYSTVVDLKNALVAAGLPCTDWKQTDQVTLAASSGECDPVTVLSVYTSDSSKEQVIQNLKKLTADYGGHLVSGENWLLNTPDAEEWAEKLGGMPITW